jgi:competence protein ComEC
LSVEPVTFFAMDEIQRKLALIDKQLADRNFHERIISTCPLLFIAVGLIAGILIQYKINLPVAIWLILLVFLTTSTVCSFIFRQSSINHKYATAYLALACFACLGGIRLISFHQPRYDDIQKFVLEKPELATISGLIITEPYINTNQNWKFAQFKHTDPTSSFYLRIFGIKTLTGWTKATGIVRVQVDEPVLDLKTGDSIQAYCWLDRFKPPTNPGQFDTAAFLARRNIFIAASVKSRDGITTLGNLPIGYPAKFKERIRWIATQALLVDMPDDNRSRGLLQALLLGYRRDIDSDTYRAFRKTGLLHFISLSGMHLGILIGIVWWSCKIAGLMKPVRAIVCMIAIALFLLIVSPRAPTIRAAVIGWVFCASFIFRRHSNSINTLSLAAIILLLIRPTQLFEAGWQLSFATVLGIILFTEPIENFIFEHTPKVKSPYNVIPKLGIPLARLFSVGFAAWLGGAGILLYHFYSITPLAGIWTVLVFPLVSAILVLGFLKMVLFFLMPTLSAVLAAVVTLLSHLLIWFVKFIASLDISQILIGSVPLALIIMYYFVIIFLAGPVFSQRPRIMKQICAVMLLTIIIFLGTLKWHRTHRENLVLTSLDVGHGQAILARLPGKANILFDTGSLYRSDVGTNIVAPFLDYTGTNQIDAIVISHNDTDHINGIPEVVEHCKIYGVYANDAFFDESDQWGTSKFLSDTMEQTGIKIKSLKEGFNPSSEATVKTLWPNEQISKDIKLSDNDKSLVTLIEFAETKILLCSDIEEFAQKELFRLHPDLKADIVVIPHHGSVKTLEPAFLKKLDADVLICSCDQSQYERVESGLALLVRNSDESKIYYTAKDGAVTITIQKDGTYIKEAFSK